MAEACALAMEVLAHMKKIVPVKWVLQTKWSGRKQQVD